MDKSPHPDQPNSGDYRPSISVFFPCHNEDAAIETLVGKTIDVLDAISTDYEIIIVDDGSTDDTGQIADRLAAEMPAVRVVHHDKNRGYGAALQSGFRAAVKELVFYTDGDAQFDIAELTDLPPLMRQYDIVSCYRRNRREGLIRRFNAFCWGKLVSMVFGMKLRDVDCAFKLYKRRIFDDIEMKSTGALIDAEILARARKKGYTITQRPVSHYPRRAGRSSGANIAVIARAFAELFRLRRQILADSKK